MDFVKASWVSVFLCVMTALAMSCRVEFLGPCPSMHLVCRKLHEKDTTSSLHMKGEENGSSSNVTLTPLCVLMLTRAIYILVNKLYLFLSFAYTHTHVPPLSQGLS